MVSVHKVISIKGQAQFR